MKITKTVTVEMTEKEFRALDCARDYLLEMHNDMGPEEAQDFTEHVNVLDEMDWHVIC